MPKQLQGLGTALQGAAEQGHLGVVNRLLKLKADVNAAATEGNGRTILQGAAEQGHLEVVDRAIKVKADVNAHLQVWSNSITNGSRAEAFGGS